MVDSKGDSVKQIAVERVSHVYRPARGREVLALEDVSLEIGEREFVALLGPSGCGKSTLLYLIGGFLPIEKGAIRIEGAPVAGPGPDRGIVFQHFALFPWRTVRANVRYGLEKLGLPREKLVVTVDHHGNTSAASVPLALDEFVRSGKIRPGHRVLLQGVGGGFTWGSSLVTL